MSSYPATRDALVLRLRQDAAAHEAERYDAVGRDFDRVEHHFPHGAAPELLRLHVALTFWDAWIDARNHGWPRGPIALDAWPRHARAVADDLEAEREITDAAVLAQFDSAGHPARGERAQTLAARLRGR